MTSFKSFHTPFLFIAIVGIIFWTEAWTWQHIREVKDRAETVDSERFHRSAQLEVKVRALHDAVFHDAFSIPPAANRSRITERRLELTEAFSRAIEGADTTRETDTIQRAGTLLNEYLNQIDLILNTALTPADLARRREVEEKLADEVISSLRELATVERLALKSHLAIAQISARALHRQFILSSCILLAMGGALAVLVYRGIVAPLRRRLLHSQTAIERQEKLSSLGVLAAGVAHEIRNPLTSIKVRLFTQQQLLKQGTEEFEDNLFLTDEISRLEKIVKDFLAFARPSDPEFALIQASKPVRDLLPLLLPLLCKSDVQIVEEYVDDPPIRADAAQIKQVLFNLTKNAAEAMPNGGVIRIRTSLGWSRRGPRSENVAVLEISDTGGGVPLEIQKRLFDPFFTTKASGTGLGLSIASRIIEKHGGSLEFSTENGLGTTFRILLPIANS